MSNLIARYTTNASGVVPVFNNGFVYTKTEVDIEGIYTIELYSDNNFTSCSFRGLSNLLTVEYLKITSSVTSMNTMFDTCVNLTKVDLSDSDTCNVTLMNYIFNGCINLTEVIGMENFNTNKVTNIQNIFTSCSKLIRVDLSNWDVSNVTTFRGLFYNCKSITSVGDLSKWTINKVINMEGMFYNCQSLNNINISGWDLTNVTNTKNLFSGCTSLTKLFVCDTNYTTINKIIPSLIACNNSVLYILNCSDSQLINITLLGNKDWKMCLYKNQPVTINGIERFFKSDIKIKRITIGEYYIK